MGCLGCEGGISIVIVERSDSAWRGSCRGYLSLRRRPCNFCCFLYCLKHRMGKSLNRYVSGLVKGQTPPKNLKNRESRAPSPEEPSSDHFYSLVPTSKFFSKSICAPTRYCPPLQAPRRQMIEFLAADPYSAQRVDSYSWIGDMLLPTYYNPHPPQIGKQSSTRDSMASNLF